MSETYNSRRTPSRQGLSLHDIAVETGRSYADGALSRGDVSLICWAHAQGAGFPQISRQLAVIAYDAALAERGRVERISNRVRHVVRPMLERRATKAQIEEAAGKAAGEAIGWGVIYAILREEVAALKRQNRGRQR